jgi:biotin operon repressor
MRKIAKLNDKVYKVLASVSLYELDNTGNEFLARQELSQVITNIRDKYNNLNLTAYVQDLSNVKWKNNDHFTKVFDDEIKYCKHKYNLTRTEISFLKGLGEFLLWQINMLVDEDGNPLNQTELSKLMDISTRTIRNNMKSLEEKKCIFSIPYDKDIYYLVNPYLLYKGGKINMVLPALFSEIGYIPHGTKIVE